MKVVITGGGGFLGRKLAERLLQRSQLSGGNGPEEIEEIVLFDQMAPPAGAFDDARIRVVTGDILDATTLANAIQPGVDTVFHLAAVVSAGAASPPSPACATPRSLTMTAAPCAAQCSESSRPIPRPAPVIATTFPFRHPLMAALPFDSCR